ncbi:MAG TPA: hypothetical protein VNN22_19570 [Verrucomicrobiae bacterium]|nr:hypothetical protein [Verrucomicrobiae bacterium]
MAGTTLDRQLTTVHTGRLPFALATPADDADIRRLLRENPMPGQITLTLEREPDYFADADLPGTEKQTIIANEGGRMVCVGNCSIRERFVNGQPRRVGYLGGLRLDSRATGRFDILRRGYEFFRELQTDKPADYYFTSIAADNLPARKFLERGLPGMPAYEFAGEFVTLLIGTPGTVPARCGVDGKLTVPGVPDTGALFANLHDVNRSFQFAPCWTTDEITALRPLGLRSEDFQIISTGRSVITCAALWDQRAFKQTVIRGYSPWLAMARPAVNFAARIIGKPRLPAAGSVLAHAFVSHLAVEPENPDALIALIAKLRMCAAGRRIGFLMLGLAANDPRLTLLRRKFNGREYRSRIYVVRWPGLGGSASELDGRCHGPEVALL